MKQTPMQELIEYTEKLKKDYNFTFDKFFNKANELLEKEKQLIFDSFEDGTCNQNKNPKTYYNETFKQK
jgi:hypothetical protein